jgi:DNA-binding NtrC family response regulator
MSDMLQASEEILAGSDPDGRNLNDLIDRFERDMILKALQQSNGVKNRAAQLLGIKRTTLVEKMK